VQLPLKFVYTGHPENRAQVERRLAAVLPQVEGWYGTQGIHLAVLTNQPDKDTQL